MLLLEEINSQIKTLLAYSTSNFDLLSKISYWILGINLSTQIILNLGDLITKAYIKYNLYTEYKLSELKIYCLIYFQINRPTMRKLIEINASILVYDVKHKSVVTFDGTTIQLSTNFRFTIQVPSAHVLVENIDIPTD